MAYRYGRGGGGGLYSTLGGVLKMMMRWFYPDLNEEGKFGGFKKLS